MAAPSRLLLKLREAVAAEKYYEAHQLLKTLNFRLTASNQHGELERLLAEHADLFLDSKQFESGMDVAILLLNLHQLAKNEVTEERATVALKLLQKMPPSPERGQFIHQTLDWMGASDSIDRVHSYAANVYVEEKAFEEAWKHIVRLDDGKMAAARTMQIIQGLGAQIKREELGLVTATLVVSLLASKRVAAAEQAFVTMVQTQDVHHLTPLLNGVRYLVESAKANDRAAFQSILTLYDMSFARDPGLRKLVAAAGKSLFNLQDERGGRGAGGLMSLFSAFMNPDMQR